MLNGHILKNWRMNQKPKVSRVKIAELLSRELGHTITVAIVRDMEEERSAKWVKEYGEWATANWDEDTKPFFRVDSPKQHSKPLPLFHNASGINREIYHCDGFLNDQSETEQLNVWHCPITLSLDASHYRAVEISGNKLAPIFPHGTVLLFQKMTTPPLDSIVISALDSDFVIGHFSTDNRNFQLLTFEGEKVEISRFKPFGALIGTFQNYRPGVGNPTANISWNDEKTLVFFQDQFRGILK